MIKKGNLRGYKECLEKGRKGREHIVTNEDMN